MPELDDITLLKQFAETDSESAFAEIVSRHLNLVYSTALRSVGNVHAAQEISQAVFIILARKAKSLGAKIILSGWLYQTTRLTAANFLRTEIRRQNREQEAFMQSTLNETESEAWLQIAPILDDVLSKLGAKDRDAIVLRFFENKNLSEVGAAIGASEDAAKMRVNRALEKLRKFFAKRGVAFSATIIAGVVSANSVQAAPAGLVISTVAAVKGSAATVSTMTLVKGTLKVMTYAKLKLALGIAAATLLTAGTLTVALSSDGGSGASVGEASAQEKTFSAEIMQATKDEDYQAFIADGDKAFQKGITELQFKAVCVQLTPRLKSGYDLVFLGALKQEGYHVTLWKVAYSDGGDDELLTLSVKNGKIGGAWIH
ncbi:MAG TPA: sigma-70 family RNA polymerase sigma factor [Verrucomicrobiae bacterium]|jgi:RNA polymerase sigma factor (sigma-70 family)|nr:sigma-70 family RNA polymerase sigma factor [Verrucomicrobiae bacterium]